MSSLDRDIAQVLADCDLSQEPWAIAMVRRDVEFARGLAAQAPDKVLPNAEARSLHRAASRILRLAEKHDLLVEEGLRWIRALQHRGLVDEATPSKPGDKIRHWLWPSCEILLDTWDEVCLRPRGKYLDERAGPSPALEFLEKCCKLVDPTVNTSAILYAREHAVSMEANYDDTDYVKAYEQNRP